MSKCLIGDCRVLLQELEEGQADLCIADPPYGDTSLSWDSTVDGWVGAVARILKPNSSIWLFGSLRSLVPMFEEMRMFGFKYSQDVVWEKQNGTGFHSDRFRRVHEHAVLFYRGPWSEVYHDPQFTNDAVARSVRKKGRPAHTGNIEATPYVSFDGGPRMMTSVLYCPNEHGNAIHPTQKPLGILAPLIRYSCPPKGLIVDPFAGSGSVGVCAELLGRQWIGCELNPAYVELQERRTSQMGMEL